MTAPLRMLKPSRHDLYALLIGVSVGVLVWEGIMVLATVLDTVTMLGIRVRWLMRLCP